MDNNGDMVIIQNPTLAPGHDLFNPLFPVLLLFSDMKAIYTNPIAIERNGGWRYAYGNMFYAELVNQYLTVAHFDDETTIILLIYQSMTIAKKR